MYIGNALRLVNGVIPYRDFAMVQPPGSMLLMVPAALVGKAFGSISALATARILTVGADTANVVLVGTAFQPVPLAAGVASGGYAVYPAALERLAVLVPQAVAEPVLPAGSRAPVRRRPDRRLGHLAWAHPAAHCGPASASASPPRSRSGPRSGPGGVGAVRKGGQGGMVGRAASPWAGGIPGGRPPGEKQRCAFAGGFAAGIVVPCLPFEILAPSGFGRTVFVSRGSSRRRTGGSAPTPRVAEITGIIGLSSVGVNPRIWQGVTAAAVLLLFVVTAWVRAGRASGPPPWTGSRSSPPSW